MNSCHQNCEIAVRYRDVIKQPGRSSRVFYLLLIRSSTNLFYGVQNFIDLSAVVFGAYLQCYRNANPPSGNVQLWQIIRLCLGDCVPFPSSCCERDFISPRIFFSHHCYCFILFVKTNHSRLPISTSEVSPLRLVRSLSWTLVPLHAVLKVQPSHCPPLSSRVN